MVNVMYNDIKRFIYETNFKSEMIYMQINDDEYFIEPDTTDIIYITVTGEPHDDAVIPYAEYKQVISSNKNFQCIGYGDFSTKIKSIRIKLYSTDIMKRNKVISETIV